MPEYLILKLQGVMQSWGGHTFEDYRPSGNFSDPLRSRRHPRRLPWPPRDFVVIGARQPAVIKEASRASDHWDPARFIERRSDVDHMVKTASAGRHGP